LGLTIPPSLLARAGGSGHRIVDRRAFIFSGIAALVSTLAVEAQQPAKKMPLIGLLQPGVRPPAWVGAFRQGLRELGYIEGQNILVEHRIADKPADQRAVVDEFIRLKVDVIMTWGTGAIQAARHERAIPIVGVVGNPVQSGLASTLAKPGGNFTGLSIQADERPVKTLQLLREALPTISRVAVLWNPDTGTWGKTLTALQEAAATFAVKLELLAARAANELDTAFARATASGAGAMLVLDDGLFTAQFKRIVELEARHRLPVIHGNNALIREGGLISHGAVFPDLLRRAAVYVDKILKGAKPGDLPIEQPIKYDLIINLKTAKALNLTIPQPFLLRADQVIE
jgi:putative tryptophan/tyrosine transport system substrate-binding protein